MTQPTSILMQINPVQYELIARILSHDLPSPSFSKLLSQIPPMAGEQLIGMDSIRHILAHQLRAVEALLDE